MPRFKQKSVGWHSTQAKTPKTDYLEKDLHRDEPQHESPETLDIDRVWWIGLPRKPGPKKGWF